MFQSIRPNSQLYIFHKGDALKLDMGYVMNQPIPKPKYTPTPTFGQPQEMVVDLVVKVNNDTINLNGIPAQLDIADSYTGGENIVVSTSRDAINAEVLSTKQKSLDVANSREYHLKRAEACDEILSQLNPEYAEKQSQKEEMSELKKQMSSLDEKVSRLIEAFSSKQNTHE